MPDPRLSVAVAILSATACAHGGTTAEEDAARAAPAVEPHERIGDGAHVGVTARLASAGGVEIGVADMKRHDGSWRLEVEVSPSEGAPAWEAFVVRGDCARDSGRIVQLSAFVSDGADGFASATEFPSAWLKPGTRYAIAIDDGEGSRVACGDLGAP